MPKPLDTLVLLVELAGHTPVEENNLTQTVATLRKALGQKRGENRYTITDPRQVYRFVAGALRRREW